MVVEDSTPNEGVSLAQVYSNYEVGRWNHNSDYAFCVQLLAEGRKRLDAFVFEHGFEKRLREIANANDVSLALGWHIGYDGGKRTYWIRLVEAGNDWTLADDQLVARLSVRRDAGSIVIIRASFDEEANGFLAQRFLTEGWEASREARSLFSEVTGRTAGPVREMSATRGTDVGPALAYLFRFLSAEERKTLSVRRRFINGLLSPHLGRDPADLDALALSREGRLTCIEMKRKYPATRKNKFFGVDEKPHIHTMRMLASMDIRMLHIILVAPRWNDSESPVGWLSDSSRHDDWTWLTAWLSEDVFVDGVNMATRGDKSGQRAFNRIQRAIDWKHVRVLNQGIRLTEQGRRDLAALLEWKNPELAGTSYALLQSNAQRTRPRYGSRLIAGLQPAFED
jgi:hypothetical protein